VLEYRKRRAARNGITQHEAVLELPASRPDLVITDRYWASKAKLAHRLKEIEAPGACRHTIYLKPESVGKAGVDILLRRELDAATAALVGEVVRQVEESETGLVVFAMADTTIAVIPPFPVEEDAVFAGSETADLVEILEQELTIGVVLLRLGKFAVGVFEGGEMVASKSDSRYVKNRHRAGGSSQRRYERSRDRLVRELYDEAGEVTQRIFAPYEGRMDYILMGGEKHTLREFVERCEYVRRHQTKRLSRQLEVERPGHKALENIPYEIWKSRVLVFKAGV